jgi:hypothetical protein
LLFCVLECLSLLVTIMVQRQYSDQLFVRHNVSLTNDAPYGVISSTNT